MFFGREASCRSCSADCSNGGCVVVVGASGSGKSSLVRARCARCDAAGRMPGSADVVDADHDAGGDTRRRASASSTRRRRNRCAPCGVAVDQMEEMFTACSDPAERAGSSTRCSTRATRAAAHAGDRRAARRLLRPLRVGARASRLRSRTRTVLLGPMDEADVRRAIEAPAAIAGLRLEPGLVDVMLRDLGREPGSLPLLSHALLETWRRRAGTAMTLTGYQESGGVRGAIAHTAETRVESGSHRGRTTGGPPHLPAPDRAR